MPKPWMESGREEAAARVMRAVMAAALKKEWEACPVGRRMLFVESGGTKESAHGEAWRFTLKGTYIPVLSTGRQVSLHLKGLRPVRATVVEHAGGAVALEVRGVLPVSTPFGYLLDDPQWILQSLRHAMLDDREDSRASAHSGTPPGTCR